jgi:DNA-binding GntR family transcriptional regulator
MGVVCINYQSKNDYVYSKIKKDILQKVLKPGQRLVVSELAKKLDSSPMPVREAIVRLAQEEFVELIPHVGASVISYNEQKLFEIHQIRIELEPLATRLLAPVITDKQIKKLDDIMNDGKVIIGNGSAEEYFEWNQKFHCTIAEMNPNRTLGDQIITMWQKLKLIGNRYGLHTWRLDSSYEEHMLWTNALRLRDPVAAEAACRKHCTAVNESNLEGFI